MTYAVQDAVGARGGSVFGCAQRLVFSGVQCGVGFSGKIPRALGNRPSDPHACKTALSPDLRTLRHAWEPTREFKSPRLGVPRVCQPEILRRALISLRHRSRWHSGVPKLESIPDRPSRRRRLREGSRAPRDLTGRRRATQSALGDAVPHEPRRTRARDGTTCIATHPWASRTKHDSGTAARPLPLYPSREQRLAACLMSLRLCLPNANRPAFVAACATQPRQGTWPRRAHWTASASTRRPRSISRSMRVAVAGCAHGELDVIYDAIREAERATTANAKTARGGGPVELLICPGDFQAVRNEEDLECMAVPDKFKSMNTFWRYYAGEVAAPVPTVFVGGNHEATNHLQEIPLGGLVAPNMYYIGNAGVINFKGLRIGGISGVYVPHNYEKPRNEKTPYPGGSIKSVYHSRKEDVDRLMRLSRPLHMFVSHDWPQGITAFGDEADLLRRKPFLRREIQDGSFGSPGSRQLLEHLKPPYWFSAHVHVKFPALYDHGGTPLTTKFLALDKPLPRRDFLQILDIPRPPDERHKLRGDLVQFELDLEWLTILRTPGASGGVSEAEIARTRELLQRDGVSTIISSPSDFERNARTYDPARVRRGTRPDAVMLQKSNEALSDALSLDPSILGPASRSATREVREAGQVDGS